MDEVSNKKLFIMT